ncbi:MAG TPA: GNAT family N-acetyltransferase [Micromonosporaceae bacterium]
MTHGPGQSPPLGAPARGPGQSPPGITVRPYRPADHNACRRLWAELVEHRGELYGRADGADDGGVGFEEYLTRLDLSGIWVAHSDRDGVVGFVGLRLDGRAGAVDPVVVTRDQRGRGIGRALLTTVAAEARRRGLSLLTISPSARDHAALRSLRAAGFGSVSSVTLAYALTRSGRSGGHEEPLELYDLRFHS